MNNRTVQSTFNGQLTVTLSKAFYYEDSIQITVPSEFVGGGQITLIPTGLWSTGTSGNIAIATTGVVSKALILSYDATTAKWYPSY